MTSKLKIGEISFERLSEEKRSELIAARDFVNEYAMEKHGVFFSDDFENNKSQE